MHTRILGDSSYEAPARLGCRRAETAANRRAYNRAYMRAWRADPRNLARERAARQRAYFVRKLREALHERLPSTNDCGLPLCGFCRRLSSVGQILRLRVCEHARRGYVQVRVPYCGEC